MDIITAGHGGQGVLFLNKILIKSISKEKPTFNICSLPSYGSEARSGVSRAYTSYSEEEIISPITDEKDFLIIMNLESLLTFYNVLKENGTILYNSSLIKESDKPLAYKEFQKNKNITEIAINTSEYGKTANMVMLGAYIKITKLVSLDTTLKILEEAKPDLFDVNKKALIYGFDYIKS